MRTRHQWVYFGAFTAALVAAAAAACSSSDDSQASHETGGSGGAAGQGAEDGFTSPNPNINPPAAAAGSPGAGGEWGAGGYGDGPDPMLSDSPPSPQQLAVSDSRLYTFSEQGGLSVLDISQPGQVHLVGRYATHWTPAKIMVRDGLVLAVLALNQHPASGERGIGQVLALDASNPAQIKVRETFEVPGQILDARLLGDNLYVTAHQERLCYHCDETPYGTITSISIANPQAPQLVQRLKIEVSEASAGSMRPPTFVAAYGQDRIYISGLMARNGQPPSNMLQVVDISDPSGAMTAGPTLALNGEIKSPAQIDESQGVLRVLGADGESSLPPFAFLQTFEIQSSQNIVPLAEFRPDPVPGFNAVAFDGPRVFYSGYGNPIPPIAAIDLTAPAHPHQGGSLPMTYLVSGLRVLQDGRLLAYGSDSEGRTTTLSLLDSSSAASPVELDSIDLAPYARISDPSAIQVLPDQGLMLLAQPVLGCQPQEKSGIQLIDFTSDSLTLRGVAHQGGYPRQGLMHNGQLLGIFSDRAATFDITNPDQPVEKDSQDFLNNTVQSIAIEDKLIKLSSFQTSGLQRLSVVPVSAPESLEPIGLLDTSAINAGMAPTERCYGLNRSYQSHPFTNGNLLYLVWSNLPIAGSSSYDKTHVAVFDISDSAHPRFVSDTALDVPPVRSFYNYDQSTYLNQFALGLYSGTPVIQLGSTLGFWNVTYPAQGSSEPVVTKLYLVDLSNPAQPVRTAVLDLPAGLGSAPPIVADSVVMSSHWEAVPGDPSRVRFFADQLDLSNPAAPRVLGSVNVPGALLTYDPASHHMVTWEPPPNADSMAHLKLLNISGFEATELDSLQVQYKKELSINNIAFGEDRIFLHQHLDPQADPGAGGAAGSADAPPIRHIQVIGGIASGHFEKAPDILLYGYGYDGTYQPIYAQGTKVIVPEQYPLKFTIYETANLSAPAVQVRQETLENGWDFRHLFLTPTQGFCSLGEYGFEAFPLSAP